MKKMMLPLLLACSFVMLNGCRNSPACCTPYPPPPGSLFLSIKHNGQPYPDSLTAGVKLYYYYNAQKITDPNKAPSRPLHIMYTDTTLLQTVVTHDSTNEFPAHGLVTSIYAVDAVVVANINQFYLEFPDGDVDTLYMEAKAVSQKDIESVPCKCLHQITNITLNGKPMQEETIQYPIYPALNNILYLIEK